MPEATWFVAERDGDPLGGLLLWADPGQPISIDVAATLPEARGLGVGKALTEHALRWARDQGHERTKADWRVANLSASRFWPNRGFRPTAYRMVRYLHPQRTVILREPANALDPRVRVAWTVEGLLATLVLAILIASRRVIAADGRRLEGRLGRRRRRAGVVSSRRSAPSSGRGSTTAAPATRSWSSACTSRTAGSGDGGR